MSSDYTEVYEGGEMSSLGSKKLVPATCKVALLAGGTSGEREVSLASGKGAHDALVEAGFQVTQLDPADKQDLITLIGGNFDVAFLCVHGQHAEDGTLQGFLEIAGLPYIGSGIWSSATAIDKAKAKLFYEEAGLHTPQSIRLTNEDTVNVEEVMHQLGSTCVVKPSSEGSALGVYITETAEELSQAIKAAESYGDILIEQYISGTEVTVAVLGNEELLALPVIEIVPQHGFYDYESKYTPGGSQHICPAPLSEELTKQLQEAACKAHKALHCKGVSRSDFIIDANNTPWILETNTLPGMTSTSLLPDAARVAEISFPELCTKLIEYALD